MSKTGKILKKCSREKWEAFWAHSAQAYLLVLKCHHLLIKKQVNLNLYVYISSCTLVACIIELVALVHALDSKQ